ncbi:MAG: hypothetical protein HY582_00630, partial [Candidatus Omnitrophica bacterium]|nr:hypothetical protein [Candidatus Omnitrophota bacterium]
ADIKEVVDSFEIEADHTIKGFELKGEQHWEQVRIDQTRQENTFRQYWDTPANKSIVRQQIKPESKSSDTRFNVAKWFLKEKVYASSGYRFFVLKNQEWESVLGYNEFGTPAALSHGSLNNRAENSYDSHTWVQNVTSTPFRWLSLGAKLKEEYLNRRGESTYNIKTGNPSVSTTIDRFDVSTTKFNAQRFGEAINARITAIPRTALYSELELEQSRGPLNENRVSVGGTAPTSVSENVDRETLTYIQKNVETVGIHVMPISFVDLTGHYRHYWKNNDYDDLQESPPSSATVEKSAFFDGQTIRVNEFLGRLALKLSRFFQPAFRYIHRETGYETATESEASVRTGIDSNNYIVDVTSQLLTPLFATTSFSHLDATTWTPAKEALSANTPIFESGVNTWSFSLSYSPRKTLSFINTLSYSRASNFNDFSDRGLPLGADYRMVNVESGFKFGLLKDQVSLEPKYQLYRYNANNNVDAGDYTAHVALLECKMGWG